MKSFMQTNKECFVCRLKYDIEHTRELHLHHVFEGVANRRISDQEGATVWLCGTHHNLSNRGIHFDKDLDLEVKKLTQSKYEESHSREEFMDKFGRSYL